MALKTKRVLRGATLLGVAALAVTSLGLASAPAFAAPGNGGQGTITVHKLDQAGGSIGANDGTELSLSGTPKFLAAGFKVCTIANIDLSVAADWDKLKGMTATAGATDGTLPIVKLADNSNQAIDCGVQGERLTNAVDGKAVFTVNADKAYVVYESTWANGAIAGAQPAILTVPYPSATGDSWNYSPHIYPKNSIAGSGATKTGDAVGDDVTFDVTVPITALPAGQTFTEARIQDQLSNVINHTSSSVKLFGANGVAVAGFGAGSYTLVAPTGVGALVTMNLTSSGLALLDANIGGKLVLTINGKLVASGTTANAAQVFINGAKGKDPEVVTPEKVWSGLHIKKVGEQKSGAEIPLAGAVFEIYSMADATTVCPAAKPSAGKIGTTFVSDAVDGSTNKITVVEGKYCAYEISAPAGYKKAEGGAFINANVANASVKVVNVQFGVDPDDLPSLPLTGAAGQVLLLGGGVALLGGAAALFVARRRKLGQNA